MRKTRKTQKNEKRGAGKTSTTQKQTKRQKQRGHEKERRSVGERGVVILDYCFFVFEKQREQKKDESPV